MSPSRLSLLLLPVLICAGAQFALADGPDFSREVRPILSNYCLKCHGPDNKSRKAKLRLDVRESALNPAKSGERAIVPGKPEESELVKRIDSADPDDIMPPPSMKKELTPEQRSILKRWVASGAEYKAHWAFVSPRSYPTPSVSAAGKGWQDGTGGFSNWSVNPIDGFILQKLGEAGLEPSREAQPETLIRRMSLDLIGLPPTPDETDHFVQAWNRNPDAVGHDATTAALADRLLASPQYGERWARRWLDLARYADSNGYEKDRARNVWPYRDWVVRALNVDMPFDQFSIEQIAGDLLPDATTDQRVATGFHRCSMLNEEGGIDPLEFRFYAMVDRMATTGATWLGLTLQCAQCHTHKYDPIPHREYYQMMAFLNNADEPELDLPPADAAQQIAQRKQLAAKMLAGLEEKWPMEASSIAWETPKPVKVVTTEPEQWKQLDDGSILFAAPGPVTNSYEFTYEVKAPFDQVRLEAMTDPSLPKAGPGRVAHGNFVLSEITIQVASKGAPDHTEPAQIVSGETATAQAGFPLSNAFDGKTSTGWAVHVQGQPINTPKSAIFKLAQPIGAAGSRVTVRLDHFFGRNHTIGRPGISFGLAAGDTRPLAERRRAAVEKRFTEWLARERKRVTSWTPLMPASAKSNSPLLTIQPDASVLGSGDITKSDTYEVSFSDAPKAITAVRLEALPDERLPAHGPGMTFYEGPKGDFFLGEFQLSADGQPVKFVKATESYAKNNFGSNPASAMAAVDGDPQTGWSCADRPGEAHEAVFVPETPINAAQLDLKMMFGRHYACSLGRFRISITTAPGGAEASDLSEETRRLLRRPEAELTSAERQTLREEFLLRAPELADSVKQIRALQKAPPWETSLVLRERPAGHPRPTAIHNRGEYTQPTEEVQPAVLSFLNPLPAGEKPDRLAFARWLVSRQNPLTARVAVNRAWAAFFGRGIVKTQEDFGYQGELPTHPELLDSLAVCFMEEGWSMKKLHRLIVTSAVYRQAGVASAEQLAKDPDNQWLGRFPRKRLEAEVVRDSILQASGLLSLKMGGAPVRPPQVEGVSEVAYGSPKWEANSGEDRYRRSLYTFVKRTAPFAFYNTFDAPTGEQCIARRDVSDTPLQALTLLNDVVVIEAAQALGKTLADQSGSDEDRLATAYLRLLARTPTSNELALLRTFLETQRQRFTAGELDAKALAGAGATPEEAAWTAVARALFNLDETITKG